MLVYGDAGGVLCMYLFIYFMIFTSSFIIFDFYLLNYVLHIYNNRPASIFFPVLSLSDPLKIYYEEVSQENTALSNLL